MTRKKYFKEYWLKNKDKLREKRKRYYLQNKEKILEQKKEYGRKYKKEHHKEYKEYVKIYREKNKDKINKLLNKYKKQRRETDINFKLTCNLRARLRLTIKNNQKTGSAVKDLGCTVSELKKYLENQFQEGMSWNNWSLKGWHIDHIIPLVKFNLTDREQLKKAVHYTNLQPLWAKDNLKKGDKVINS